MTGLYNKYEVHRVDGKDLPGGPKEGAEYFVLDLTHDPAAEFAVLAYCAKLRGMARRNEGDFKELHDDLYIKYLKQVPPDFYIGVYDG